MPDTSAFYLIQFLYLTELRSQQTKKLDQEYIASCHLFQKERKICIHSLPS